MGVHFLRNVLGVVPKGPAEMVATAIGTNFARPDTEHRLAGCIPIEIHDEWQIAERRYLSESSMALIDNTTHREIATPNSARH